jgi:Aldose 1-epimerase
MSGIHQPPKGSVHASTAVVNANKGTARSFAQAGARLRTHSVAGVAMAAVLALGVTGSLAMGQASAMSGNNCSPTIAKQFFGKAIEPYTGKLTPVFRYTLTNCRGMQVKIITYGATQQSITVPGRRGHKADVILGFKTLQDYVNFDSRRRRPPVVPTSVRPSAATATGSPRARSSWSRATACRPTRCRSTTTATACTAASSDSATTSGRRTSSRSRTRLAWR